MNDKELLKAAAKAIDSTVEFTSGCWTFGEKTECRLNGGDIWNPITDDGDALRLAVKLNLDIEQQHDCVYANGFDPIQNYQLLEWHGNDRYAATRKAIVCAAAQIGAAT